YPRFADHAFASPREDNVRPPEAYFGKGSDDSVSGGCTGGYDGEIGSSEPMAHGYVPSGNIQDHFGNEERIESWSAVSFGKFDDFVLEGDEAADSTGEYDPNPVDVDVLLGDSCISHGLVAGNDGRLRKSVQLTSFFFIQKCEGVETFQF